MKVEWSRFAAQDREFIFSYIEQRNPQAAVLVDERIQAAIGRLMRFPEGGRPGRVDGTRELVIQRTPYVAAYQVTGKTIRVLRILHSAQLWPEEL